MKALNGDKDMSALDRLNCMLMEIEKIDPSAIDDPSDEEPTASYTILPGRANGDIKKAHALVAKLLAEKEVIGGEISEAIVVDPILETSVANERKTELGELLKDLEAATAILNYALEDAFPLLKDISDVNSIGFFKGWRIGC